MEGDRKSRRRKAQRLRTRKNALKVLGGVALGSVILPFAGPSEADAGRIGNRICRVGRRYLGVPYVTNGTSLRRGLDCDAYVRRILAKCNIWCPWAVNINGPGGRYRRGNPRVGDVVVFSRPYHVGIYSGGGYVLHASEYFGEVVESEFYYLKRDLVYQGARAYR